MGMKAPIPLITTKILVPGRRPELLKRQRLLDFLHNSIDRKLILISAPAGYGKTSLLVDFATETNLPICWYTLDSFDSDLRIFLEYLVVSIRQRFPRFGENIQQALRNTDGEPDLLTFTGLFVNAIYNEIPEYFVIVLDDYHNVDESESVNAFLDMLLNYLPENCHIILAGRTIPVKLTLTALTARQEVAGIGASDLRFTPEEIKLLLSRNYNIILTDVQAQELAKIYEGWITGIILSIARIKKGSFDDLLRAGRDKEQIFDYLAEEVFAFQPPILRRFLLDSSVLTEMSASLCNELLDTNLSEKTLRLLDKRNLFIVQVGDEERWYRYHNLFREFLQRKLAQETPDRFRELHLKAGKLWCKRGLPEKAVSHYLSAEAFEEAIALIDSLAEKLYFLGRWRLLASWLDSLPPEYVERCGRFLLYQARICLETGEVEKAQELCERGLKAYALEGNKAGMALAMLEKGTALRLQGRLTEAVEIAKQALEFTPTSATAVRGLAYKTLGICYGLLGALEEGVKYLSEALKLYQASGSRYDAALLHHDLGNLYALSGQLDVALEHYHRALDYWRDTSNMAALTNTLNSLGVVHYYAGEYMEALRLLEEAWGKAKTIGNPRLEATILAGIGDVYLDLREYTRALDYYKSALELATRAREGFIIFYATNAIGEALRRQGKFDEALRWLDQASGQAKAHRSEYEVGLNRLYKGLLYMELKRTEEAKTLLEEALELFHQAGSKRELARALFYLAYLHLSQHQDEKALSYLQEMARHLQGARCEGFLLADKEYTVPLVNLALRHRVAVGFFQRVKGKLRASLSRLKEITKDTALEILPYLEIYALGLGQVMKDGKMLTTSDWNTATTRELFFFFLLHPDGLRKEQVMAEMWPEVPTAKANSLFHSSLYRLRRAVHPECIIYENGLYRFNEMIPKWYDVEEFESLLEKAKSEKSPAHRKELLTQALKLYQGDFLENCYHDWCLPYRDELLERYLRALLELARIHLSEGDYEAASQLAKITVTRDPFREEAYRILMRCSLLMGDRTSALRWFDQCREILRKELGVEPGYETRRIYEEATRSCKG